jgi:hypothetical protein
MRIPSATKVLQEVMGRATPSISTTHILHESEGLVFG